MGIDHACSDFTSSITRHCQFRQGAEPPGGDKHIKRVLLEFSASGDAVSIGPLELTLIGPLPNCHKDTDLRWQPNRDGKSTVADMPTAPAGRAVRISVSIPLATFSTANNFTVAIQPRVFLGNLENSVGLGDWVIVTLASPTAPPAPRLLAGTFLLGYGAVPTGRDASLHAQKTDVAIVDVGPSPSNKRCHKPFAGL